MPELSDIPDIFVSYSSKNRERVRPLVEALRRAGWSVWWDRELKPGETWDEVIGAALESARCVVVVWTQESVKSDFVRLEAHTAFRRDALVPLRLEEVKLPPPFGLVQTADFSRWDGTAGAPEFGELIDGISLKLKAPPPEQADPGVSLQERPEARPLTGTAPVSPGPYVEERVLDAAVAGEVAVQQESDLIVMVRLPDSPGLAAILDADDSYSMGPEDVKSQGFELEFPLDAAGKPKRSTLLLRVRSSDVAVTPPEKRIAVAPHRDTATFAFLVRPLRPGKVVLTLELYQADTCLISRPLRTSALPAESVMEAVPKHILTMPFSVRAQPAATPFAVPEDVDELLGATLGAAAGAGGAPPQAARTSVVLPAQPAPTPDAALANPPVPMPSSAPERRSSAPPRHPELAYRSNDVTLSTSGGGSALRDPLRRWISGKLLAAAAAVVITASAGWFVYQGSLSPAARPQGGSSDLASKTAAGEPPGVPAAPGNSLPTTAPGGGTAVEGPTSQVAAGSTAADRVSAAVKVSGLRMVSLESEVLSGEILVVYEGADPQTCQPPCTVFVPPSGAMVRAGGRIVGRLAPVGTSFRFEPVQVEDERLLRVAPPFSRFKVAAPEEENRRITRPPPA